MAPDTRQPPFPVFWSLILFRSVPDIPDPAIPATCYSERQVSNSFLQKDYRMAGMLRHLNTHHHTLFFLLKYIKQLRFPAYFFYVPESAGI